MEFDYKPNKACQSINTMKRKPVAILYILLLDLGDTAEMSPSLSGLHLLVHLRSLRVDIVVILLPQQFPLFLINTRKKGNWRINSRGRSLVGGRQLTRLPRIAPFCTSNEQSQSAHSAPELWCLSDLSESEFYPLELGFYRWWVKGCPSSPYGGNKDKARPYLKQRGRIFSATPQKKHSYWFIPLMTLIFPSSHIEWFATAF